MTIDDVPVAGWGSFLGGKEFKTRRQSRAQFLEDDPSTGYLPGRRWPVVRYGLISLAIAAILVFAIELIVRGDFAGTASFFLQPLKPGWTTIVVFALILIGLDAVLGRSHQSLMIVAPLTLSLAFVGHQKSHYLGDPLYPTDFSIPARSSRCCRSWCATGR